MRRYPLFVKHFYIWWQRRQHAWLQTNFLCMQKLFFSEHILSLKLGFCNSFLFIVSSAVVSWGDLCQTFVHLSWKSTMIGSPLGGETYASIECLTTTKGTLLLWWTAASFSIGMSSSWTLHKRWDFSFFCTRTFHELDAFLWVVAVTTCSLSFPFLRLELCCILVMYDRKKQIVSYGFFPGFLPMSCNSSVKVVLKKVTKKQSVFCTKVCKRLKCEVDSSVHLRFLSSRFVM